ncbi:MAG: hypothetical protein U9Q22_06505 [Candidatus Altiarchaeota archaeon]|nr:hypothetical protein [Candidatus Altiarchaeota archaeon]
MISLLYEVNEYRKFLNGKVKGNFVVIELGPHLGQATKLYLDRTKQTIVVDKSIQAETAMKKIQSQNLRFIKGDVRSFKTIQEVLEITKGCDLLAVDMGGGRYPDTVFKVWAVWSGIFKPRHSVIRNRGLAEFTQRVEVRDKSIKKEFPDDGWMSTWGRALPHHLKKQMQEFKFWIDV